MAIGGEDKVESSVEPEAHLPTPAASAKPELVIIPLSDDAMAALELLHVRSAAANEVVRAQEENIQYYRQYLTAKYRCEGDVRFDMEKRVIIAEKVKRDA